MNTSLDVCKDQRVVDEADIAEHEAANGIEKNLPHSMPSESVLHNLNLQLHLKDDESIVESVALPHICKNTDNISENSKHHGNGTSQQSTASTGGKQSSPKKC